MASVESARETRGGSHGARDGYALIAVLWIVVLVSVVGLEFAVETRGVSNRVANAADRSIAAAAAESGISLSAGALHGRLVEGLNGTADPGVDPWALPERLMSDTLVVGDARVVVTLQDVGTLLNLNRASELELRGLFAAVRIDDGEADRVVQAILDWRDVDDLRRARGAEREEYLEAGAPVLPRDGPFADVAELRRVRGVTDELFRRIESFLVVEGSGRINAASAPVEVLSSLPGMSDDLLATILRRRANGESVTDLFSLTADLDGPAREAIERSLPVLTARLSRGVEEILATAVAWREGSPTRSVARAIIVRVDRSALVTNVQLH